MSLGDGGLISFSNYSSIWDELSDILTESTEKVRTRATISTLEDGSTIVTWIYPGMDKSKIDASLEGWYITISYIKQPGFLADSFSEKLRIRTQEDFVDLKNIEIKYEAGVLTVKIPKIEQKKEKKKAIKIKVV